MTPISVVTRVPEALVAHPSLGVKSLPELLELAKRQPGRLNIGTAGAAGISHLTALVFRAQTGAAVEVVPYRGAAPAVTDLVAGQVQLLFADLPPLLPHIKAGSMPPWRSPRGTAARRCRMCRPPVSLAFRSYWRRTGTAPSRRVACPRQSRRGSRPR